MTRSHLTCGGSLACLIVWTACASAPPAPSATTGAPPPADARWRAALSFDGRAWRVDYTFPAPQQALLFDSGHGDYRVTHWSSSRAGVTLEHHAGLDAVFFAPPTSEAHFDLRVSTTAPDGALAVVPFSDGSHALWLGQLAVLTVEDRAAVERLQGDLRGWRGQQPEIHVEASSDVPLIGPDGAGRHFVGRAHQGHGAYLYTGTSADPLSIVDPGLPQWVQAAFRLRLPQVQSTLDALWSQPLPAPQLMLAWGGAVGEWSNRGRAEGRQIVMRIQGARYAEHDPELLGDLVWFFAHELTHLQQFAGGGEGDSWMIEGLADTSATHVLVRIGLWDQKVLERRYWSVARECARELSAGPLDRARGRAAYVCGDLVGVALLASMPRGDLARLWKAARASGEPRVTTERLLRAARELGASEVAAAAVETFVTGRHADTDRAIRALLEATGAQPIYADGSLSSMSFPFGR